MNYLTPVSELKDSTLRPKCTASSISLFLKTHLHKINPNVNLLPPQDFLTNILYAIFALAYSSYIPSLS